MKDASLVKDATRKALLDLLAVLPAEVRLAGIGPDDLAVLPPEQRLAGLSESDRVLALPDAALRALPADYLETLPVASQERIRARLGR
jgi:hypothetical protein